MQQDIQPEEKKADDQQGVDQQPHIESQLVPYKPKQRPTTKQLLDMRQRIQDENARKSRQLLLKLTKEKSQQRAIIRGKISFAENLSSALYEPNVFQDFLNPAKQGIRSNILARYDEDRDKIVVSSVNDDGTQGDFYEADPNLPNLSIVQTRQEVLALVAQLMAPPQMIQQDPDLLVNVNKDPEPFYDIQQKQEKDIIQEPQVQQQQETQIEEYKGQFQQEQKLQDIKLPGIQDIKIKLKRTGIIKKKAKQENIQIEVDPNLIIVENPEKQANVQKTDIYAKTYKTSIQDKKAAIQKVPFFRILFNNQPEMLEIVDDQIELLKKEIKSGLVTKTATTTLQESILMPFNPELIENTVPSDQFLDVGYFQYFKNNISVSHLTRYIYFEESYDIVQIVSYIYQYSEFNIQPLNNATQLVFHPHPENLHEDNPIYETPVDDQGIDKLSGLEETLQGILPVQYIAQVLNSVSSSMSRVNMGVQNGASFRTLISIIQQALNQRILIDSNVSNTFQIEDRVSDNKVWLTPATLQEFLSSTILSYKLLMISITVKHIMQLLNRITLWRPDTFNEKVTNRIQVLYQMFFPKISMMTINKSRVNRFNHNFYVFNNINQEIYTALLTGVIAQKAFQRLTTIQGKQPFLRLDGNFPRVTEAQIAQTVGDNAAIAMTPGVPQLSYGAQMYMTAYVAPTTKPTQQISLLQNSQVTVSFAPVHGEVFNAFNDNFEHIFEMFRNLKDIDCTINSATCFKPYTDPGVQRHLDNMYKMMANEIKKSTKNFDRIFETATIISLMSGIYLSQKEYLDNPGMRFIQTLLTLTIRLTSTNETAPNPPFRIVPAQEYWFNANISYEENITKCNTLQQFQALIQKISEAILIAIVDYLTEYQMYDKDDPRAHIRLGMTKISKAHIFTMVSPNKQDFRVIKKDENIDTTDINSIHLFIGPTSSGYKTDHIYGRLVAGSIADNDTLGYNDIKNQFSNHKFSLNAENIAPELVFTLILEHANRLRRVGNRGDNVNISPVLDQVMQDLHPNCCLLAVTLYLSHHQDIESLSKQRNGICLVNAAMMGHMADWLNIVNKNLHLIRYTTFYIYIQFTGNIFRIGCEDKEAPVVCFTGKHVHVTSYEAMNNHKKFYFRRNRFLEDVQAAQQQCAALDDMIQKKPRHKNTGHVVFYFDIESIIYPPYSAYTLGYLYKEVNRPSNDNVIFIHGENCCVSFVDIVYNYAQTHPKEFIQVIGFNSYKFDYQYLLPHIIKIWGSRVSLSGGKCAIKSLVSENVHWDDLRSLLGSFGSLRYHSESLLGPESIQKGSFDFTKVRTQEDAELLRNEIVKYTTNDVLLLPLLHQKILDILRVLSNQNDELNTTQFTTSLSSYVLRTYLKYFIDPKQIIDIVSVRHIDRDYFRQSYHGGRVTVKSIAIQYNSTTMSQQINDYIHEQKQTNMVPSVDQSGDLYYLDINSSYPYIMTKGFMSGPVNRVDRDAFSVTMSDLVKQRLYVISSFVQDNDQCILPVVHKTGTLIYCRKWNRHYSQHTKDTPQHLLFWGVELIQALLCGYRLTCEGYYIWKSESTVKPFAHFINTVYDRRLRAKKEKPRNAALVQITKLLMNSLSGKLGQRTFPSSFIVAGSVMNSVHGDYKALKKILYPYESDLFDRKLIEVTPLHEDYFQIKMSNSSITDPNSPGCFVHLISYITAYARARIQKFINTAGYDNFFYADTDSLVVNKTGYDRLIQKNYFDDEKLGKLKLEHRLDFFHALAPKNYIFRDSQSKTLTAHCKGVSLCNVTDEQLLKHFVNACSTGSEPTKQTQFKRGYGFVSINEVMKTMMVKRKETHIDRETGVFSPPNDITDINIKGKLLHDYLLL